MPWSFLALATSLKGACHIDAHILWRMLSLQSAQFERMATADRHRFFFFYMPEGTAREICPCQIESRMVAQHYCTEAPVAWMQGACHLPACLHGQFFHGVILVSHL